MSTEAPPVTSPTSSIASTFAMTMSYDDGDVVLRSSDGHDFRVHKLLLRLASPLFATMFSLPQPENGTKEGKIPMSEDGETLNTILRCIYPVDQRPTITSLEHGVSLLDVAERLDIGCAAAWIQERMAPLLADEPRPLRAWALAKRYNIPLERQAAARRFITSDDDFETIPPVELILVNGHDTFNLIRMKSNAIRDARSAFLGINHEVCEIHKKASPWTAYANSISRHTRFPVLPTEEEFEIRGRLCRECKSDLEDGFVLRAGVREEVRRIFAKIEV